MGEYRARLLEEFLRGRFPSSTRGRGEGEPFGPPSGTEGFPRFRPVFSAHELDPRKKSVAEKFVEEIERTGDETKAFVKYLNILTRNPATTKVAAMAYLRRAYEAAVREGRI